MKRLGLFALFLGVLGLCFLLDEPVHRFIHQTYNYRTRPIPDEMKLLTRILRSMEDWGENIYISCVAFAMWRLDRRRRSRVLCIVVAAVAVALTVEVIKRSTGRERPEVSQGKLLFHGPNRWWIGGDVQSFPSGHAAAAACYSGSLAAFYPPVRPVCIALAVGCSGNRMWKERHFLSDCWAGGCLGFWVGFTLPRRKRLQPLLAWFDQRFSDPPAPENESAGWVAPYRAAG